MTLSYITATAQVQVLGRTALRDQHPTTAGKSDGS